MDGQVTNYVVKQRHASGDHDGCRWCRYERICRCSLDLNIEHKNHHGQVVVANRHHLDPWHLSSPAWLNRSCMQTCSCLSSLPLNKKSVEKSSAFRRGHRKLPIFFSTALVQEAGQSAGQSAITIINMLIHSLQKLKIEVHRNTRKGLPRFPLALRPQS